MDHYNTTPHLTKNDGIDDSYTPLDTNANKTESLQTARIELNNTSNPESPSQENIFIDEATKDAVLPVFVPSPPPPPAPPNLPTVMTSTPLINIPEPKAKMKTFPWKRITVPKHADNIWTKVNQEIKDVDNVNYVKLEEQFYCKENTVRTSNKDQKNLLDHKKTMTVNVLLQKYKSADEVIDMISHGLTDDLGLGHYQELQKILSDKELVNMLREQSLDDLQRLTKVDYFMVRLVNIPDCELWIKMIITHGKFETLNNISPHLRVLRSACEMLKMDTSFQTFLGFVLRVGLFMNKGKVLGRAVGFELSSLRQLAETKSTKDDKFTLLEYLVNEIKKSNVRGLDFVDKLWNILQQTKSSSMSQALNDFKQLHIHLSTMTDIVKGLDDSSRHNKEKCLLFQQSAETQVASVQEEVDKTKSAIQSMADYFSEDSETLNVDELFTCCRELCEQIKAIEDRACSASTFKRGNLRASMPVGRRQSVPISTSARIPKDTRLDDILEKQRRRSESVT